VSASFLPHRRLVAALFGTLKLMQMYGREHDATRDGLGNLLEAIQAAVEDSEARVGIRGARVQVNGRTMRTAECGTLALGFLTSEWTRRGIALVRFSHEVTIDDISDFATVFLDLDLSRREPFDDLVKDCATRGVRGIILEKTDEAPPEPVVLEDRRQNAMRSYLRGLRAFKEVLGYDGLRDKRNQRRARRAVQGLVDRFLEDESAVLALAQIRSHDVKLFQHSLHVCLYSLLIGQRLAMSRRQLGELGLAALFHDLGKTAHEAARLRPGPKTKWIALRDHPAVGAQLLLDEGTTHEGMLKAAIAAYEHHVQYDRNGFPRVDYLPHLVSRIVTIADCYEALTTTRAYREMPYSTQEALSLMQAKAGTLFDPVLLKVFVNALGVYPIGTLVELSTGEVGIVQEAPAEDGKPSQPLVRIIVTATGELEPAAEVDLAEGTDGRPLRSIIRTLAPHEVFGNVGDYVAAM